MVERFRGTSVAPVQDVVQRKPVSLLDDDETFDRIYPDEIRRLSSVHWTPVRVAMRAAQYLTRGRPNAKVLDVGSGAGKFCIVGALSTGGLFDGIEQRPHFVSLARQLVFRHRVPRVRFIEGNFTELDWRLYHGIYLFNPFQENLIGSESIDSTIERYPALHRRYVESVKEKLRIMPAGTRVATYWGFGGKMPRSFAQITKETTLSRGLLEFWEKIL